MKRSMSHFALIILMGHATHAIGQTTYYRGIAFGI